MAATVEVETPPANGVAGNIVGFADVVLAQINGCPECGRSNGERGERDLERERELEEELETAYRRIRELEDQVRLLTEKASAAGTSLYFQSPCNVTTC